jgi:hypothetical protein
MITMTKYTPASIPDEEFRREGRHVVIRTVDERVEIVIDGNVHRVRFLDNGRPYTRAFVNVMATSVKDLAERFVDHSMAQEAHWAEVAARREKEREKEKENAEKHSDCQ